MREKGIAQLSYRRLAGRDRHAGADQAARAVRRIRAELREGHGLEPAVTAHAIERGAQVRRRVGERAVEIEQDCVDRPVPALRRDAQPSAGRRNAIM